MPALITTAQAREHIETDLGDAALQRIIDDADAAIIERYGAHAGNVVADIDRGPNPTALIFRDRPIDAVVSLLEFSDRHSLTSVALNPLDYRILHGGRTIERLTTGPNAASWWGERLVLTYAPTADAARRTMLEIDLVKLRAKYEALKDEGIGDYRAGHVDYEAEWNRLLGRLAPKLGIT